MLAYKKIPFSEKNFFWEYIRMIYQESNKVPKHFCYYTNVLDFYETRFSKIVFNFLKTVAV